MGSFSNYTENLLLNYLFDNVIMFVGLSTTDPLEDGSGITEPEAGSYARVETEVADWSNSISGTLKNANTITFSNPTGSWGTIAYFFLMDGSDNLIGYGTLSSSAEIVSGDTVDFEAETLVASLN